MNKTDWSPEIYSRFRGLRLRPALDLLTRVPALPKGDVIDLGCGSGAVGAALAKRFAGHRLIGIDASPAMLAAAAATGAYKRCFSADVAMWEPAKPVALIFSNAMLHWLDGHEEVLPRLAGFLVPGGTLAVQMPRQFGAPSHRFLRDFAAEMFPERFDFTGWQPPVSNAVDYYRLLAPLGQVDVWETDYVHRLEPDEAAHPVRRFTESTAMRPFLDPLSAPELAEFTNRYDAALTAAYPPEPDGTVLFPFRRLFFTVTVS